MYLHEKGQIFSCLWICKQHLLAKKLNKQATFPTHSWNSLKSCLTRRSLSPGFFYLHVIKRSEQSVILIIFSKVRNGSTLRMGKCPSCWWQWRMGFYSLFSRYTYSFTYLYVNFFPVSPVGWAICLVRQTYGLRMVAARYSEKTVFSPMTVLPVYWWIGWHQWC
jgi:hypothetical protein